MLKCTLIDVKSHLHLPVLRQFQDVKGCLVQQIHFTLNLVLKQRHGTTQKRPSTINSQKITKLMYTASNAILRSLGFIPFKLCTLSGFYHHLYTMLLTDFFPSDMNSWYISLVIALWFSFIIARAYKNKIMYKCNFVYTVSHHWCTLLQWCLV